MPVPESAASAYQSQDANLAGVQAQSLLPVRPGFPFFLVHNAENWNVGLIDGVPWWLPELQNDWLEPGVNNKKTLKKGQPPEAAYDESHVRMTRNGAVILELSVVVPVTNADGTIEHINGYLKQIACEDPRSKRRGLCFHTRWESPKPPRKGKRLKWSRDTDGFNRWRLALVAMGLIKPPHPDLIDEKKARAQYHVERQTEKIALPADVRERLKTQSEAKAAKLEEAQVPAKGSKADDEPAVAWEHMSARDLAKLIDAGEADAALDDIAEAELERARPRSSVTAAITDRRDALEAIA